MQEVLQPRHLSSRFQVDFCRHRKQLTFTVTESSEVNWTAALDELDGNLEADKSTGGEGGNLVLAGI